MSSIENVARCKEFDIAIIITTYSVNNMVCKLMKNDVPSGKIFFFPELLIDDIGIDILKVNREKIRNVYDFLNDDLSKYIYSSVFDIYMSGNVGVLSRTKGNIQYFPIKGTSDEIKEFCLSESESFIDCGAYDGDTIREFKRITGGQYNVIWAFEPDMDNYMKLSDYIKDQRDEKIHLFRRGVYSENTIMSFINNQGTSSQMNIAGNERIRVSSIDSLIDEPVTYIKMDIEGGEKEALLGAKRIIAKYKPKLAICIYHKIEDLWEIPLLIKKLNRDYQIYVRNYEDRIDETVCYAI